jgi:hypothetical protein
MLQVVASLTIVILMTLEALFTIVICLEYKISYLQDSGLVDTLCLAWHYLSPIDVPARESALKADDMLTHDSTQTLKLKTTKTFLICISSFNPTLSHLTM